MNDLTIVIPVYNSEVHLPGLFEHISMLKDISIIFVNDGSSDSSGALIRQWANGKDGKIVFVDKENRGVSNARNVGLSLVKTKYVLFLDSDDLLFIDNLIEALNKLREAAVHVCLCEYKKTNKKSDQPDLNKVIEIYRPQKKYLSGDLIEKVSLCSCIFDADFLKQHGFHFYEAIKYGEDQLFLSQVVATGNSIYLSGMQILLYFNNPDSAMNTFSFARLDVLKSLDLISMLVEDDEGLARKIEARYNKELVGVITIYARSNSILDSFSFYATSISPLIKSNNDHKTIKSYFCLKSPYLYILLYKLYRVIKNAFKG